MPTAAKFVTPVLSMMDVRNATRSNGATVMSSPYFRCVRDDVRLEDGLGNHDNMEARQVTDDFQQLSPVATHRLRDAFNHADVPRWPHDNDCRLTCRRFRHPRGSLKRRHNRRSFVTRGDETLFDRLT